MPANGPLRKVLAAALIVVLIVLILLIQVNTQELYETKEIYYEKEPYTTTETYYEKEPYIENVPIDYRITEASYWSYILFPPSYVWVKIKNTDTKSGYFSVTFNIITEGGASATRYASAYISIGEEKMVQVSISDRVSTFTYSINPPTKEVTKYRDVPKQRTITLWRDVPKERRVLQVRTVQKPIYQIIQEYLGLYLS